MMTYDDDILRPAWFDRCTDPRSLQFDLGTAVPIVEASRSWDQERVRYVIRIGLWGGYFPTRLTGRLLSMFDVDANHGQGLLMTTLNPGDAITFATLGAARSFGEQQSRVRPLRHDGKPNRPLVGLGVSFEWVAFLPSGMALGKVL